VKNERSKPEPGKHPISAESQPDDFLIAAFILGADGMMESFRRRAIEAGHSGAIPGEEKLQSLINERYRHPALDGTSIKELAERNFTAGAQTVLEVFTEQAGLIDISAIRSMERLRCQTARNAENFSASHWLLHVNRESLRALRLTFAANGVCRDFRAVSKSTAAFGLEAVQFQRGRTLTASASSIG
jgi:hypothetical protein